jgi:hypothetical protein
MDWLRKKAEKLFPPDAKKYRKKDPPYKSGAFFNLVFCNSSPTPLVYTLNPERLNERLIVQQGLFIVPADISKPFEENLDAICRTNSNCKDHIWKIIIEDDVSLRCNILKHLYRMNINRASLFPGLGGVAELQVSGYVPGESRFARENRLTTRSAKPSGFPTLKPVESFLHKTRSAPSFISCACPVDLSKRD